MIYTLTARRLKPGTFDVFRIQGSDPGPSQAVAELVDEVLLDGSYDVVVEMTP